MGVRPTLIYGYVDELDRCQYSGKCKSGFIKGISVVISSHVNDIIFACCWHSLLIIMMYKIAAANAQSCLLWTPLGYQDAANLNEQHHLDPIMGLTR